MNQASAAWRLTWWPPVLPCCGSTCAVPAPAGLWPRAPMPRSAIAIYNRDLLPALQQARQLAVQLEAGNPSMPLFGVGLSLGGTMLLNAQLEQPLLDGLVCISSPLDLVQCADQFDRPRNRLYRRWVLRRLRQLTLEDLQGSRRPHALCCADRSGCAVCGPSMRPSPHRVGGMTPWRLTTRPPVRCSPFGQRWKPGTPCPRSCCFMPPMTPGCRWRPTSSWRGKRSAGDAPGLSP